MIRYYMSVAEASASRTTSACQLPSDVSAILLPAVGQQSTHSTAGVARYMRATPAMSIT